MTDDLICDPYMSAATTRKLLYELRALKTSDYWYVDMYILFSNDNINLNDDNGVCYFLGFLFISLNNRKKTEKQKVRGRELKRKDRD